MKLADIPTEKVRQEDRITGRADLDKLARDASILSQEKRRVQETVPDFLKFLVRDFFDARFNNEIQPQVRKYGQDAARDQNINNIDAMAYLRSLYTSDPPKYSTFRK